jgi:hypothetical protein
MGTSEKYGVAGSTTDRLVAPRLLYNVATAQYDLPQPLSPFFYLSKLVLFLGKPTNRQSNQQPNIESPADQPINQPTEGTSRQNCDAQQSKKFPKM